MGKGTALENNNMKMDNPGKEICGKGQFEKVQLWKIEI